MAHAFRFIVPIAVVGCAGAAASAQFVREPAPTPPVAPVVAPAVHAEPGVDSIVTTIVTEDDGSTYEMRVDNGQNIRVRVNGKDWPASQVEPTDRTVIVRDKAGRTLHTFKRPHIGGLNFGDGTIAVTAPADADAVVVAAYEAPPVMLGINMTEPGDALRAHLGLGDTPAIMVEGVIDGLSAQRAGLQQYDVIVSIDGSDGATGKSLSSTLRDKKPGDELDLGVIRSGKKMKLTATLDAFDADKLGWAQREENEVAAPRAWVGRTPPTPPSPEQQAAAEARWAAAAKRAAEVGGLSKEDTERLRFEMQRKAEEAMGDLDRKLLEFRNGQLYVRSADELQDQVARLKEELRQRVPQAADGLDERLATLENRLNTIESTLDARMERLTAMLDRLIERLDTDRDGD